LLNELALFQIPKEHHDKSLDWYGSICSDEKNHKVKKFKDDLYITIETLKGVVTQNEFSLLFHYLNKGIFQYIYIDTKSKPLAFFEFEKESKQWVEDEYIVNGFVYPFGHSQQSKSNIALELKNNCSINKEFFPNKMNLVTKSFEQLLEFVERKDSGIETNKTKLIIKNTIINKSLLYANELFCYFKLSDIELISNILIIDINFIKNKIIDIHKSNPSNQKKKTKQQLQRETVLKEYLKSKSIPENSNFADDKYGNMNKLSLWDGLEDFFLGCSSNPKWTEYSGKLFDSRSTETIKAFFRDAKLCSFDKRNL
jgi:hypothetical protein